MSNTKKLNLPINACIPSPIDSRDVLLSAVSSSPTRIPLEFPPLFDLNISDQNGFPHCVGYASATIKEEKENRERNSVIFDGDWIYKKCKEIDEAPNLQGTYLRVAMKILQKTGAKPLNSPEANAGAYRIGGYARVDNNTFEGLKRAIAVNGALLAGFTGSNEGWGSADIRPPKTGERTWGHAVALVGYKQDRIIIQNSWGKEKGDGGFFYMPANYIPFEAWAILTDLPTDLIGVNATQGWVAKDFLNNEMEVGDIVSSSCRLNIRKEPNGEKILTMEKDQKLVVIGDERKAGAYTWINVKII
jgi:hypothetical protein